MAGDEMGTPPAIRKNPAPISIIVLDESPSISVE